MKFKALFTDRGLRILEKGFLPTMEKFGKTCQLLLGPDEVHFIQTTLNTDGAHMTIRFAAEVIFERSSYRVQSKHYNLIAFSIDVGLLLRVLRSAGLYNSDTLEVKLTLKNVGATPEETKHLPFLTFHGRGASLSLVQDLPISKPYSPAEIMHLVEGKEVPSLCPFYVDLHPVEHRLQSACDRMKNLGEALNLSVSKVGDLHLQVAGSTVVLGSQVKGLAVFPQTTRPSAQVDRAVSVEEQLLAQLQAGDAASVCVQMKHVARVLKVAPLTAPSQLLCGIADSNGYVHLLFVYRNPMRDVAFDDTVSLSLQLPVRDDS